MGGGGVVEFEGYFFFSLTKKSMHSYAFIPHPEELLLCVKCNRSGCTCILLRQLRCAKLKPMNLETTPIRIKPTGSLITFLPFYLWETKQLGLPYIYIFFFSFLFFRKWWKVRIPGPCHLCKKKEDNNNNDNNKNKNSIPHTSLNP